MTCAVSARCLRRAMLSHSQSPVASVSRSPSGRRQYAHAALKTRPQASQEVSRRQGPAPVVTVLRSSAYEPLPPSHDDADTDTTEPPRAPRDSERRRQRPRRELDTIDEVNEQDAVQRKPDQLFADHLNGLFAPLKFPPELSARILTHASHPAAFHGHNAQFSFIGRRVLESYLLLLLSSSPHLKPTHDLQEISSRVLNTYLLGEHIGSKWGLGRIMRWTPTIPAAMQRAPETREAQAQLLKDVGLYKIQGDAVAAVMGGIFQQFGASVAHRVFHTRVLPRLLLADGAGLPLCFHPDANEACQRFGGASGRLLARKAASQVKPKHAAAPATLETTETTLVRQTV
ncbi:RNase III domain-containing protein [Mycena chlorophos]|uniref:RNase III domain-containing protein n=1 Tax=Mycena chlorophos TaxID=658473 RepID=A0A8H6W638_MYCCL|nr:RNase III domain-containing protein [Mycena chlorophos]